MLKEMKINVHISHSHLDELYFTGKTVVVIDVLRATSTIVTALMNGAKEVIPVGSVEFAMKASSNMFGGQTLLGGERNTKKIDGFNLGNSPFEYSKEIVNGRGIVLFTTNGTKAIVKTKFSDTTLICAFLNLSAVAKMIVELNQPIEIVCSGRNNGFSLEDTICAGKLISEISTLNSELILNEAAEAALSLSKSLGKNIKKMLMNTEHGKILIENGFESDITFCSKLNITDLVPQFISNTIKATQPKIPSTN